MWTHWSRSKLTSMSLPRGKPCAPRPLYLWTAMTTNPQLTGLLLPSREAVLWPDSDFGLLVDAAKDAEAAGYDSVWVGDSLLARPRGEPMSLLAAIAGATKKV